MDLTAVIGGSVGETRLCYFGHCHGGGCVERRPGTGTGAISAGILSAAEVRPAKRKPVGLDQNFFEHALIPALNRLGITPVGAFKLDIGPETPTYYLLIPATSVETLVTLETRLAEDAEFLKASSSFWGAPAAAPAFVRVEEFVDVSLCRLAKTGCAEGRTKDLSAANLRERKRCGPYPEGTDVQPGRDRDLYSDRIDSRFLRGHLDGGRMPSLTYMLTFADVADLNKKWAVFVSDPAWKELARQPGNTDPEIVSNISNLYLSPLACSQI